MAKTSIDYLSHLAIYPKTFFGVLLAVWVIGVIWIARMPEELRVASVLSVGTKAAVRDSQNNGFDLTVEPLEPLSSVVFRLEEVFLPMEVGSDLGSPAELKQQKVSFHTNADSGTVVIEVRTSSSNTPHFIKMLGSISKKLLADHERRYQESHDILVAEVETINSLLEALERRLLVNSRSADRSLEEGVMESIDLQPSETKDFISWSRMVYLLESSSNIEEQRQRLMSWRSTLNRGLALVEPSRLELEPTVDYSRSYGPSKLMLLVIVFFLGFFAAIGMVVALNIVRAIRKHSKASSN